MAMQVMTVILMKCTTDDGKDLEFNQDIIEYIMDKLMTSN
jgi:hypothetical protein